MEYEVMNTILYNTVSSLFQSKHKHLKYFQANIPTDRSITEKEKIEIPKKYSNVKTDDGKPPIINTIEDWLNDANRKLNYVMKKLNINQSKLNIKYLNTLGLDEIEKEKSKVKKELQEIDKEFTKLFKREPAKNEKEVLRPLYVYYNDLKQIITNKKGTGGGSVSSSQEKTKEMNLEKEKDFKRPNSSKQLDNESQLLKKSKNEDKNNKNKLLSDQVKRPSSAKLKAYQQLSTDELINELQVIKDQQILYKQKLHDYQKDFHQRNNRKVKYYKDIEEVEFEYNSYKENRLLIKDIEDIIEAKMK